MAAPSKDVINTDLLCPEKDYSHDSDIEVSIVVPALNEEITIGEFVDWCWEGIYKSGVSAEIIIVDSSSDKTSEIALSKNARVLRTPKRGLGHAYIDAIPYIRGKFIIMGDCDLTYDFREINPFVQSYRSGNEFVIGSRFSGSIENGAMPALHRYFGTPLTTWILNRIYHSKFTDIHCGMRGITKEALIKINLSSMGWEYASEMVLKASRLNLKLDEVPVNFYKDREGRLSHHRRAGFFSPWYAGWINLKVMLVYSPDSFLIKPGIVVFSAGLILSLLSSISDFHLGPMGFGSHVHLLGFSLAILGFSFFQAGIFTRYFHGLRNGIEVVMLEKISYDKGMFYSAILFLFGVLLDTEFVRTYVSNGFVAGKSLSAIWGLLLIVLGVQVFVLTLLLEMVRRLISK